MTTNKIIKTLNDIYGTYSDCGDVLVVEALASAIAKLRVAEELVEHILTSESMNPELGLALAYRAAGRGDE